MVPTMGGSEEGVVRMGDEGGSGSGSGMVETGAGEEVVADGEACD